MRPKKRGAHKWSEYIDRNNKVTTFTIAEICEFLLVGSTNPVFACKQLLTECFIRHMHAYEVTRSETHLSSLISTITHTLYTAMTLMAPCMFLKNITLWKLKF